ncbi:phosphate/phosphite/phosphonate ABC transporter substrate-binding protein [Sulfuriferula sp. AH1]|uniref:phosphate/phosphite/phosphonate ABC transporter substrate-binding protein n=1 Tax=Sulfuriferula sp. AH1 TaxID=1985873 RepID=UPI0012FC64C1|nr:PhnD/SsuA/transferrin family substrate-binding protein [Sulfuriferula sp. AH1]
MNRRRLVQVLLGTAMLPSYSAHALLLAGSGDLIMAIFPGTGAADIDLRSFKDYTHPLTAAIADKIGKKVYAESYRSFSLIKNVIDNARADVLFVPPTLAVNAMQHGYEPVVRVKDFLTGMLIKRKGETVTRIAMTGPDSWPGAMGLYLIAERKLGTPAMVETVKNQDAVVFLLKQGAVQAGVLGTKIANNMIATGQYEAWFPLTSTPGFTLLMHQKLMAKYAEPISQTMLSLSAPAINGLQTLIPATIKQFVPCGRQDYEILKKIAAVT